MSDGDWAVVQAIVGLVSLAIIFAVCCIVNKKER